MIANLVGVCMGAATHLPTVALVLIGCGVAAAIAFASERGER